MDNLSANKTPAIRRWAKRDNVELCFTPTNAAWPTRSSRSSGRSAPCQGDWAHPNHTALARRLHAYLRWRNAHARQPDVWPPSAANAPASAANASNAGAAAASGSPSRSTLMVSALAELGRVRGQPVQGGLMVRI